MVVLLLMVQPQTFDVLCSPRLAVKLLIFSSPSMHPAADACPLLHSTHRTSFSSPTVPVHSTENPLRIENWSSFRGLVSCHSRKQPCDTFLFSFRQSLSDSRYAASSPGLQGWTAIDGYRSIDHTLQERRNPCLSHLFFFFCLFDISHSSM